MSGHHRELLVEPAGRAAPYPVHVGPGAAAVLPALIPGQVAAVALIADSRVAALHGEALKTLIAPPRRVLYLPAEMGEQVKHREHKAQIEDALIAEGLGRDSMIVALGGGVTTDLCGFIAATYLRGIPWIAMPTSLVAAVDAAVGGKTGVNTRAGKNLIGAFHHPLAVIVDLDLLSTLPAEEIDNGLAEMIKHAVIADPEYLDSLLETAQGIRALEAWALGPAIARSIEIKAEVVAADPEEADLRQVLNLGHTIGHAIEAASDFAEPHGRAVAAGLSVEAGLATRLGLLPADGRDRLRAALVALGLPLAPPATLTPEALLTAMNQDKKRRQGRVRFVLPAAIGEMARGPEGYAREVQPSEVLAALEELRLDPEVPASQRLRDR